MELDLRRREWQGAHVPRGYRLVPWSSTLLFEHAEAKYLSFRDELDAEVFPVFCEMASCRRLMEEIAERDGFIPEGTWLAQYVGAGPHRVESCGTIQAVRVGPTRASIQNVGVTPFHRGRGVGAALILASIVGMRQVGVQRLGLEVTAKNDAALRLYKRLGFQTVKTIYKTVEAPLAGTTTEASRG